MTLQSVPLDELNKPKGKQRREENEIRPTSATAQRAERRANRHKLVEIDWKDANAEDVLALIVAASRQSAAVTFGRTKEGEALRVTVLDGGERYDEYCRPSEDIGVFLQTITSDFE